MVNQVQDREQIPDWLIAGEVDTIRHLLDLHQEWKFVWIPREGNEAAHQLAKRCARQHVSGLIRPDSLPNDVLSIDHDAIDGESV